MELLANRLRAIRGKRIATGAQITAPTYADVSKTHLMFVREIFQPHVAMTSEYVKVMPEGGRSAVNLDGAEGADRQLEFVLPSYGHFTSDIAFHIKLPQVGPGSGSTFYRWASLPGVRILREVSFLSDRVTIDSYDADDVVFHNKFRVPADRRPAWERMVGQEETKLATYFNRNGWTGEHAYRDGLQTPKTQHLAADLWVPANLWMCESVASALPSSLIPASQRRVVVSLEALSKMLFASDGCGTDLTQDLSNVKVEVAMYVNCLFTNPEVAAIFQERVGVSMIRVHRSQTTRLVRDSGSVLMNNLKWPLEYVMLGARDIENASSHDRWHLMGRKRTRARADYLTVPVLYYNGATDQLVARDADETTALDPILSTLGLQAESDMMVYPALPANFFSSYLPGRYTDETRIVAAGDPHAYLMNFCLWPGRREQTGTLDASAIRDLQIVYTSTGITSASPSDLIVKGMAVNFLVRSKDRVHLKYGL